MALEKIPTKGRFPMYKGVDMINAAILAADKAQTDSGSAVNTANTALSNSESTQTQLDEIVIRGDSSVEAAQARVTEDGQVYGTLKERLDSTIVLSAVEPDKAEIWYEDKGESPINFNPGDGGVSVVNAITSDDEPNDKKGIWFDIE